MLCFAKKRLHKSIKIYLIGHCECDGHSVHGLLNGVFFFLPPELLHWRVPVYARAVESPLICWQFKSRPLDCRVGDKYYFQLENLLQATIFPRVALVSLEINRRYYVRSDSVMYMVACPLEYS